VEELVGKKIHREIEFSFINSSSTISNQLTHGSEISSFSLERNEKEDPDRE